MARNQTAGRLEISRRNIAARVDSLTDRCIMAHVPIEQIQKRETDMTTVINTPQGIEHAQMARCIAMLTIEVRTGMKHSRGSVLKLVQDHYGCTKRTKKGALEELRAKYEQAYGRAYGSNS